MFGGMEVIGLAAALLPLGAGLVYWWIRGVRWEMEVKSVRYKLYAARDRLFIAAARGLVPASSRHFRQGQEVINTLLQVSEKINLISFIRVREMLNQIGSDPRVEEDGPEDLLTEDGYAESAEIMVQAVTALFDLCVLNSNLVWVVVKLQQIAGADVLTLAKDLEAKRTELLKAAESYRLRRVDRELVPC